MAVLFLSSLNLLLAMQAPPVTITGTVRDAATGEPIVQAAVHLTDLHRTTTTDGSGRYVLRDVPPGPQHISVRVIGYEQRTLHALVPREGMLEINIALEPKPVMLPAVEVRSQVPVRGVESRSSEAFPEREMSIAAVRDHPLLAEPDVFQALSGGPIFLRPESPSGLNIRGGTSDQTAYLLDGIPVFSPYHAAGVFSAWNPDALSDIRLLSVSPSPSLPHSLSGTVEGITLAPGRRFRAQGGASTTQARVTVDGPLGPAGYLVSLRWGLPNTFAPKREASYPSGESGDRLAKVTAPLLGGRINVLGYESTNEIEAAAAIAPDPSPPERLENTFSWNSRSLGASWTRDFSDLTVEIRGWSALSDAGAVWHDTSTRGAEHLEADRRDEGLLATLERRGGTGITTVGVRVERSGTSYWLASDTAAIPTIDIDASTPVAAVFVEHATPVGRHVDVTLGVVLAHADGSLHLGPRTHVQWNPIEPLTLSGSYARTHQFSQSLRNAESVVSNVFPADLYVGAGAPGIPVGTSDQGVIAADYRVAPGITLGAQAYTRSSRGLVLVAPRNEGPFATNAVATGTGRARGVSLDAAMSTARYGLVASYGLQNTQFEYGDSTYVPEHGVTYMAEAGVIVFPSATLSVRLGATGLFGRRTTPSAGGFEWESCNLLDLGCEFQGSPRLRPGSLGVTTLPPYLRVDLGLRKHWHLQIAGRDASLALFGTVSNVFGLNNILTYATDPATGERSAIEMRPLAPLVIGLDWQF